MPLVGSDFKRQVYSWRDEGIIDGYQAQAILAKYKLAQSPAPRKPQKKENAVDEKTGHGSSKVIAVVSTIGAILVGIGVIMLVASNWKVIPAALKIALLFAATGLTYFVGWKIKFSTPHFPRVGEALLFLASLLVGATIFLTAQIFNVKANSPWLMLLWFIAIAPLAYVLSSKPILVVSITTFAAWLLMSVGEIRGIGIFNSFTLYLAFGICLYGLGQLHKSVTKFSSFVMSYQGFGLFFILASYFYFSLESAYRYSFQNVGLGKNMFFDVLLGIFGLFSLFSVGVCFFQRESREKSFYEFLLMLVSLLGWAGIVIFSLINGSLPTTTQYGYTILANSAILALFIIFTLLLFALSIGSIIVGYYKGAVPFVNIGLLFFVLGILHLYFNTAYRLLPKSFAFIGGGISLIIAGVFLEKKRREIIRKMSENE